MINSLARGLRILKLMAESSEPVGVTEIAEALQVDPSSSYRLLSTLEKHGFVIQEAPRKKYRLGYAALDLAEAVLRRNDVAAVAQPHLRALVAETGESAHLAVRDGTRAVFLAQEVAPVPLRVDTPVGSWEPIYCTAVGKVLIAELPGSTVRDMYGNETLVRHTDATITNFDDLVADLTRTRARGYAYDDEELHPGVRCLASSVRGHEGVIIAACGISGPTTRLTRARLPELVDSVMRAAAAISHDMGYTLETGSPAVDKAV